MISEAYICKRCYYDCYTCKDYGQCLTCNATVDFRSIDTSSNRCVCQLGYYDNFTQICLKCPYNCTVCTGPTTCSSCNIGYQMSGALCISVCPLRFIRDSSNSNCIACRYDCETCDNNNNCLTCNTLTDFRVLNPITKRC